VVENNSAVPSSTNVSNRAILTFSPGTAPGPTRSCFQREGSHPTLAIDSLGLAYRSLLPLRLNSFACYRPSISLNICVQEALSSAKELRQ
jgi:hypothetical protein